MLEAEFGPHPVITVYLDGPAGLVCGVDDRGICGGKANQTPDVPASNVRLPAGL